MFNRKNLVTAFSFLSAMFVTSAVFAQEHAAATGTGDSVKAMLALAAGLGMGIASLGGALGQGKRSQRHLKVSLVTLVLNQSIHSNASWFGSC